MKRLKISGILVLVTLFVSCGSNRTHPNTSHSGNDNGVVMTVSPERNGGAPDALELTIQNNTDETLQFGANYTIERLIDGRWVNHELGNFAVIAIMYMLPPGESGKYTVNLFSERVQYPEGEYRVVKQINVGEADSQPVYADFRIIEPR